MHGQDAREKSEKLDKAVKEGRCWVEVTDAGIELYNFPQANRSKGVTLTSSVETEQRGKVSDAVHRAARAGLEVGGVSLSALTSRRAGSAPALTTPGEPADNLTWDFWSQMVVKLERAETVGSKF